MKKQIITFINDRYMSMNLTDIIFKALSYFAYSYIMVIPTAFVIFDVQKYGFDEVSFLDDRVVPVIIAATALSLVMAVISFVIYRHRTKWSVILIRGLTFFYISVTLFFLSCFNDFEFNIVNICTILIKLLVYGSCILLYKKYLFKKKLPNIEAIVHGQISGYSFSFIAPALVIFTRPLLMILFRDTFTISLNWLVSVTEYLFSLIITVNYIESFTKTYFAKKYAL